VPQWRVRDVMTTEVIVARDDASFAETAAVLAASRISAVPVVDRFDTVVGVVSWTDLRDKVDIGEPRDTPRGWLRRWAPSRLRWPGGTASDVMCAPAVTVGPEVSLQAAARVMYRRNVGRLVVVDDDGRVRGIVTRSDLLKVHRRLDAVIRDEVMQQVLRRTLMLESGAVRATVDEGVVTLTGRTGRKSTAVAAARLTAAVTGVTDVTDQITFDVDDTVAVEARTEPVDHDPLRGGWIGRRHSRPDVEDPTAGSLPGHAAYAEKATNSAATL
jgi:CBS domain-containing protein